MQKLNLPEYPVKTRIGANGKTEVFDEFRKKYVLLSPEEWVRQQFLRYLVNVKKYPASLIAVEKGLTLNRMQKRFDAVVHNDKGLPVVLIEFKSAEITLEQKVFEQIAVYNMQLKVEYLIISNGLQHFCCAVNYEKQEFTFLKEIPEYSELIGQQ
ncbi:MAG TPA: type I restriction enzyme HsdR N-terminal domain-containing protein [Bacteroidales bacterium]